jgi:hypothetical protein
MSMKTNKTSDKMLEEKAAIYGLGQGCAHNISGLAQF